MQYILTPKQTLALRTPANEILYGGAAGAGKSHLLRVVAIVFAMSIPGLKVYLFRRTYPDLMRNHMEGETSFWFLLAPFIRSKTVKWNGQDNVWHFKNGSIIRLCHCQYEKDVWLYQGSGIHFLLLDESTHFTELMYRILRSFIRIGTELRIPDKFKGYVPRIISATNPRGVGAVFFKSEFVDVSRSIKHIWKPKENSALELRQYIPATRKDNPFLDEGYEGRIRGMGDEDLVEAMLEGFWGDLSGLYFARSWNEGVNWVQPFKIPRSWRVDRSFDWGSSKPYSVGWWAQSDGSPVDNNGKVWYYPRNTLFRIGELYGSPNHSNKGLHHGAEKIAKDLLEYENGPLRKVINGHRVNPGPADTNIWDESQTLNTIAARMSGEGVNWTKARKGPGSRVMGWDFMAQLFRNSGETNEEPGLYVFNNCVDFKRTVPQLPRDERIEDDIDSNAEDHIGDETRYRVLELGASIGRIHKGWN